MSTNTDRARAATLLLATLLSSAPTTGADPCGMVPPAYTGDDPALTRVGVQRTFVFHKDGVQSIVIQPAFEGRVHEFGMLVPFPNPPEIKKVADDVFEQIQASIDPPEVQVRSFVEEDLWFAEGSSLRTLSALGYRQRDQVVVLREEAVGMYELAVLEAGSAAALSRWMEEHGYRYPEGMDAVCQDYVDEGWCFVAVKTRVGAMPGVEARPGMRDVEPLLPEGASFDGAVQAMSFRFRSEEIVVPMRLSAFNGGELHNAVYVLADQPLRIRDIPRLLVARQISGEDLFHNLLRPLPVRIHSGETWEQLDDSIKSWAEQQRDPYAKNGVARDLFAADLLAADGGGLLSPLEEREKQLLNLGEALGLRGDVYDDLVAESMRSALDEAAAESLGALEGMTLTVIDGLFPRSVLAAANLTFEEYEMPAERNQTDRYDAKLGGPAPVSSGSVHRGTSPPTPFLGGGHATSPEGGALASLAAGLGLLLAASLGAVRRRKGSLAALALAPVAWVGLTSFTPAAGGSDDELVAIGERIVALVEQGDDAARAEIAALCERADLEPIVLVWARAARIGLARDLMELAVISRGATNAAEARPLSLRALAFAAEDRPTRLARAEVLLRAVALDSSQQSDVRDHLLSSGAVTLAEAARALPDQNLRRSAASWLGALATDDAGRLQVASAVVDGLGFDMEAVVAPWAGGALFLPGIQWPADQARALTDALVRWMLWAERTQDTGSIPQIENNLRSLQLANVAGYSFPNSRGQVAPWLASWGQVVGKSGILLILLEQGALQVPEYQAVVDALE